MSQSVVPEIRQTRRPPYFSPEREKQRARKHVQKIAEIANALRDHNGLKIILDLIEEEFLKAGVFPNDIPSKMIGSPLFYIALCHNNGDL
jgi:hypothetical protein